MNSDEELLYSRQIAAYGSKAMDKISKLNILLIGIRGLGIEISKNIILAGPHKITIYDNNKITMEDLGSNFYLEEKDIGQRRDEISLKKLKELNYNVECHILKDGNFSFHIDEFDIIIITEIMDIEEVKKLNKLCHEKKKGFIYGLVFGLTFFCFVDYGEHVIKNSSSSESRQYFIKDIKKGKNTIITIDNEFENLELNEGDYVVFKDIKGIKQLLDGKKRKIIKCEGNKFEIEEDSNNYDNYIQGGIAEEVIDDIIIHNKDIEQLLYSPDNREIINPRNKELHLHLAYLSLHEYFKTYSKLPENTINDINNILNIMKKIFEKNEGNWCKDLNIKEEFLTYIFKYSSSQISPICSYAGGVVSQEIIKYIGLYNTINQWFRAEFMDILDKDIENNKITKGTRYEEQILIFGDETQKKLENLRIFMIGAGAVGCELLKNFALMGVCTNPNSLLTVTDHDRIEKSNLSRQFLFRENDISKLKSECAIISIKVMNKDIKCKFMEELVDYKTENIFNKEFFEKQNAVILAVDNFEARTYISELCEKYNVPYFNCGTDGPYANVEAFIPGKTEKAFYPKSYKKVVPPCTLKMFPSSINHCVLWSLNHFEKYFNKNIKNIEIMQNDLNKYYEEMNNILDLRTQFNKIKKIFKFLKIAKQQNFNDCIKYSIKKYYKFYIYNINDVLSCYPPDKINKETGLKFWTGNKIMPHPLEFDVNDNLCFEYIKSLSCLLANCLNINTKDINIDDYIKEYIKSFKPKASKKKTFENKVYYEEKIKELKGNINLFIKENTNLIKFQPRQYEKDTIDINEINYIYFSSILRAKNYNLPLLDKIKIKIIAGKIMPALITSTASIAGLLALQLYVLCQNNNIKNYRTGVIDLSDNTLSLGIPTLK